MRYIALLRGINVGGNRKIEMKRLRILFESLDYENVSTYLNSGNVIFDSDRKKEILRTEIEKQIEREFGFPIHALVKTETEMKAVADAIPVEWENNHTHKSDVAYLFPEIDTIKTIEEFPIKKEYINIRYVKGTIFWNIDRNDYNKSCLNKLIGNKLYQLMTVRNVNTARFLAGYQIKKQN